jgi:tryptophan 2,3-dioxygenase
VASLRRISTILRIAAQHFEVMETLPTREYLAFRDKLMGASGFQSAQLRQLEILFGLTEEDRIPLGPEGDYKHALRAHDGAASPALVRVRAQLADTPTLRDAVHAWLARTPIDGVRHDAPDAERQLDAFVERFLSAHAEATDATAERARVLASSDADHARLRERYEREKASVRAFLSPSEAEGGTRMRRVRCAMLFIETYRELPLLAWPRELLEGIVELEGLFVVFRQRHARMVERVIGRRPGTGGSAGVEYLDQTALAYRVFRDLWAIRTLLTSRDAAPALENPEFYDFRVEA